MNKGGKTVRIRATEPQSQFLNLDCKHPAFVGGYGSGKTHTMIERAILDALISPDALVVFYEPNYDLIRRLVAPRLLARLYELGIPYDYNKTENFVDTHGGQMGNFIMRSLDNPERIVGYESFRAHVDEIDVLPTEHARQAWQKIAGRNRQKIYDADGVKHGNRVSAYSTPEGYKFMYDRWVKNKTPGDGYEMVQAASESNIFLDREYIRSLEAMYPANLVAAYLKGEFVNLSKGTVYHEFERAEASTNLELMPAEVLHIGMDFNVTNMSAIVLVNRDDGFHAVSEITKGADTPDMIAKIKARYPTNKIVIYPDASGKNRSSANASTSDLTLLRDAGFTVKVDKSNPKIEDRVLSVNAAFKDKKLWIHPYNCPEMVGCLEQQAYDDKGKPDKSSGHDHLNDALGYFVWQTMPIRKKALNLGFKFFKFS